MGQSTNGQLCYGIVFEEDQEFPWNAEPFDGDEEDWWMVETGWEYDGEEPFTQQGDYKPGFSRDDPRVQAYFAHRREWKRVHPLPVQLVDYCSGDYPMWIIAVPSSIKTAYRGDPQEIDVAALTVDDNEVFALLDFCRKYELDGEAKWWLSSYWG